MDTLRFIGICILAFFVFGAITYGIISIIYKIKGSKKIGNIKLPIPQRRKKLNRALISSIVAIVLAVAAGIIIETNISNPNFVRPSRNMVKDITLFT